MGGGRFYHAVSTLDRVSDVTIRPVTDEELDTVASLIVDAYAEHAAHMSPDAWSTYANEIANVWGRRQDAELLVAETDGVIIGAATMYLGWRGAQEGTARVSLLAVPPEQRGLGVGRKLMEGCVQRAKDAGKQRLVMTTTDQMVVLRELTERMGFVREPGLDHEPAPGVRYRGYALTLEA
jgi:GNAT superfamily N-acetyltransferase